MRCDFLRWALAFLLILTGSGRAELLEEVELRKRGLFPNTRSLRTYLRSLRPSEGTKERIEAYFRDLSSEDPALRDYGTRMLAREGASIVQALRPRLETAPPEVRRRLRLLIEYAEQALESDLISDVFAVIAHRGVSGLAPEVLSTLPLVRESAQSTGRDALIATATRNDEKLLLKASRAGDPALRAAAIEAYGKVMELEAIEALLTLANEPTPSVRLAVAFALARLRHERSVELLVGLLECPDSAVRFRCARLLRSLAGKRLGYAAYAASKTRAIGVAAWRQWLADPKREIHWEVSSLRFVGMRQRILVASVKSGRSTVTEIDFEGRVRREHTVSGKIRCIRGLPNGNALVSLYDQRRVEEYDARGQRVWTSKRLVGRPTSVQRLSNGNTLVAFSGIGLVAEIAKDSKIVWSAKPGSGTYFALRLPSGITRVSQFAQRKILDLDREGKIVREVSTGAGPFMATELDEGGFLACFPQINRVVLLDENGKVGRGWGGFQWPTSAFLLPTGEILVGDRRGVHLVSRTRDTKPLFRKAGIVWISYY